MRAMKKRAMAKKGGGKSRLTPSVKTKLDRDTAKEFHFSRLGKSSRYGKPI